MKIFLLPENKRGYAKEESLLLLQKPLYSYYSGFGRSFIAGVNSSAISAVPDAAGL